MCSLIECVLIQALLDKANTQLQQAAHKLVRACVCVCMCVCVCACVYVCEVCVGCVCVSVRVDVIM